MKGYNVPLLPESFLLCVSFSIFEDNKEADHVCIVFRFSNSVKLNKYMSIREI
jgi:hypothetical protein